MKIFNEKNEVIGQVVQDENSYRVSWLVPKEYYSEGNFLFIGEYQTQNLAIQKLHEFLDKRAEIINKCNKIDRFFMITIYSFIAIAVIIILLLFCKS